MSARTSSRSSTSTMRIRTNTLLGSLGSTASPDESVSFFHRPDVC